MLLQKKSHGHATEFPTWENLFGNFLATEPLNRTRNYSEVYGTFPAANITESENEFLIELAIPGKKKEDFSIEVKENLLTISSESKTNKEETEKSFTRKEFNYESFKRSFKLPAIANSESIGASYFEGILKISIPKKVIQKDAVKSITVL